MKEWLVLLKKVVYKTSGREELSFSAPKEVVLEAKVILTPIKLGILKIAFSCFVEGGSIWLLPLALHIWRRNNPTITQVHMIIKQTI